MWVQNSFLAVKIMEMCMSLSCTTALLITKRDQLMQRSLFYYEPQKHVVRLCVKLVLLQVEKIAVFTERMITCNFTIYTSEQTRACFRAIDSSRGKPSQRKIVDLKQLLKWQYHQYVQVIFREEEQLQLRFPKSILGDQRQVLVLKFAYNGVM